MRPPSQQSGGLHYHSNDYWLAGLSGQSGAAVSIRFTSTLYFFHSSIRAFSSSVAIPRSTASCNGAIFSDAICKRRLLVPSTSRSLAAVSAASSFTHALPSHWCSDDFEAANATLDYLLIKSGAKLKDYFKAVATNLPVVNELPPEGELSLTFCDYYQLAKDNMTWTQIPGVTPPSSEAAAAARQHIVDGVDTETGEVLEDHTEDFENKDKSPTPAPELTVVATMPLRHRVLAQYIGEGEYLYHVDASQKKEILRLEMDTDNSYVQNLA